MYYIKNDYIAHHGTKGQKWGVRKYQNKDGSYTSAGKARYYTSKANGKHASSAINKKANSLYSSNRVVNYIKGADTKNSNRMKSDYKFGSGLRNSFRSDNSKQNKADLEKLRMDSKDKALRQYYKENKKNFGKVSKEDKRAIRKEAKDYKRNLQEKNQDRLDAMHYRALEEQSFGNRRGSTGLWQTKSAQQEYENAVRKIGQDTTDHMVKKYGDAYIQTAHNDENAIAVGKAAVTLAVAGALTYHYTKMAKTYSDY